MPVDWIASPEAGSAAGHWLLSGRVVARPFDDALLLAEGSHRIQVNGDAVRDTTPGDLVRVVAVLDEEPAALVVPPDPTFPVYRALSVERVHPAKRPFSRGTETFRLMVGGLRERLALRAAVAARVRAYFVAQQFLEVETPFVVTSPGLDLHLSAYEVRGHVSSDPTGPAALAGYLITSPEYHMKRLLVGGVDRCFQLARCARAGEVGRRHQPEFTMLEWYRAWAALDDVLADTENVVRAAASAGPTPGALTLASGAAVDVRGPFDRLTVREAFARHAPEAGDPIALAEADEARYFRVLAERVEPGLGHGRPAFLTRFPARHASLARLAADDPTVCERAELYVAGVELSNGFLELTDPVEQRARLERDHRARVALGWPAYPVDEEFLAALDEGLAPSAGNALGFDRLVALVAGRDDIGDVMAFAHAPR